MTSGIWMEYADGHRDQIMALHFEAELMGGTFSHREETTTYGYFARDESAGMAVMGRHVERLRDVFSREPFP